MSATEKIIGQYWYRQYTHRGTYIWINGILVLIFSLSEFQKQRVASLIHSFKVQVVSALITPRNQPWWWDSGQSIFCMKWEQFCTSCLFKAPVTDFLHSCLQTKHCSMRTEQVCRHSTIQILSQKRNTSSKEAWPAHPVDNLLYSQKSSLLSWWHIVSDICAYD